MNWTSPLDIIVNALSGMAFIGFLVFVVIYFSFSNWRATPPGRALMYAVSTLDLVALMNTAHLFTGPYPGQVFVRIPVYGLLALSAWRLVVTLVAILREGQPITVSSFVEPKPPKEGTMSHIATTVSTDTVPEIWFKAKRVIRTVIQVVVSAVITFVALVAFLQAVAPDVLTELAGILPASWIAWAAGAVAFLGTLAGALARIMAIPKINALLTKIGAGSVPADAIYAPKVALDVKAIANPEELAAELNSEANRRIRE